MNLRTKGLYSVISALTLLAAGLVYGAIDANRNVIEDIYKIVTKALAEKDVKTITSYETDDFKATSVSGRVQNRSEADSALESLLTILKISKAEEQVIAMKMENGTITVTVSEKLSGTFAGTDGKDHLMVIDSKSRNTWVKVDQKWRIKRSDEIEDASTLDGKKLPLR
jgi:hypothetical protein